MISWPNWRSLMPAAGQIGVGRDQAEHVPRRRVAVEAEQQVRPAQVEEAQGVGLDDLGQVHQAAQLVGGRGDVHRQDAVARLGRGQQVADRADPADARRDRRHLPEGPALAEALEAAELGHVEAGVAHLARVVQVDAYLRVALDAGDRVDHNALSFMLDLLLTTCRWGCGGGCVSPTIFSVGSGAVAPGVTQSAASRGHRPSAPGRRSGPPAARGCAVPAAGTPAGSGPPAPRRGPARPCRAAPARSPARPG